MNDCSFGVSPIIYPEPERKYNFCTINIFLFLIYNKIIENVFIYLLTPVYFLLEFLSLFITFFIYVFSNII